MNDADSYPIQVTAIVNAVELNHRHGVGILINRIFAGEQNLSTFRTLNIYEGINTIGHLDFVIGTRGWTRHQIQEWIDSVLGSRPIDRILCIPYNPEEVEIALAIQRVTNAPICTYVMDDRNMTIDDISDRLMAELLLKSQFRLGISPEMCDMYAAKYKLPMYFAPPVLPLELVDTKISIDNCLRSPTGIIIGNIWSGSWLNLLRQTVAQAGLKLDWYGNTGADWNIKNRERLMADGIKECGFLPTEAELAAVLRTYPYVIVPSGTLDRRDRNQATSWLSLPSRIITILASANTPIIVLGNPSTAAARFVDRLEIGYCVDYDADRLQSVIEEIMQPSIQLKLRENAARIAPLFINDRMDEWIWQSLALGYPIDDRFAKLLDCQLDYQDALATCMTALRDRHTSSDLFNQMKRSAVWQSVSRKVKKLKNIGKL
jgi:hypothetical protein